MDLASPSRPRPALRPRVRAFTPERGRLQRPTSSGPSEVHLRLGAKTERSVAPSGSPFRPPPPPPPRDDSALTPLSLASASAAVDVDRGSGAGRGRAGGEGRWDGTGGRSIRPPSASLCAMGTRRNLVRPPAGVPKCTTPVPMPGPPANLCQSSRHTANGDLSRAFPAGPGSPSTAEPPLGPVWESGCHGGGQGYPAGDSSTCLWFLDHRGLNGNPPSVAPLGLSLPGRPPPARR